MTTDVGALVARTFREEGPRIRASLIRALRDFSLADDALATAMERALVAWPRGVPDKPGAWLMEVARNAALDQVRKRARHAGKEDAIAALESVRGDDADTPDAVVDRGALERGRAREDDRLRLVFVSCHPALAEEVRVALTLQAVGGLTAEEIARAFLVETSAMEKRLARAKQKIRAAVIPFEVPAAEDMPERVSSVLHVLYLVFNEGYLASRGDALVRTGLVDDAIRIARLLVTLLPNEPELLGLLALMLLTSARTPARTDASGELVLLDDQDRTLWDRARIAEGLPLVERALRMGRNGPFQIQAAIAALHAEAERDEATGTYRTDWAQIAALYAALVARTPTPVVRLNHAAAVAMAHGIDAGLSLLNTLAREGELDGYHLLHAARADLLRRKGARVEARGAYQRALGCVRNATERRFLERRLNELA